MWFLGFPREGFADCLLLCRRCPCLRPGPRLRHGVGQLERDKDGGIPTHGSDVNVSGRRVISPNRACLIPTITPTPRPTSRESSVSQHIRAAKKILQDVIFGTKCVGPGNRKLSLQIVGIKQTNGNNHTDPCMPCSEGGASITGLSISLLGRGRNSHLPRTHKILPYQLVTVQRQRPTPYDPFYILQGKRCPPHPHDQDRVPSPTAAWFKYPRVTRERSTEFSIETSPLL